VRALAVLTLIWIFRRLRLSRRLPFSLLVWLLCHVPSYWSFAREGCLLIFLFRSPPPFLYAAPPLPPVLIREHDFASLTPNKNHSFLNLQLPCYSGSFTALSPGPLRRIAPFPFKDMLAPCTFPLDPIPPPRGVLTRPVVEVCRFALRSAARLVLFACLPRIVVQSRGLVQLLLANARAPRRLFL